jgi:hypothetical protein
MPENEYRIYFAPDYKLHLPISNMENQNSKAYLDKTIEQILDNITRLVNRPGVQINVNANDVLSCIDLVQPTYQCDGGNAAAY